MGYELTRGTLASKKRNVIQVHGRQLNPRDFGEKKWKYLKLEL